MLRLGIDASFFMSRSDHQGSAGQFMSISARENDVFLCPSVDLLAMRAAQFAALDFRGRPQFLPDRLTTRRQFGRRRAADEKTFDDWAFSFRRGGWCKEVHI